MLQYKECGLSNVWLINGYRQDVTVNPNYIYIDDKQSLYNLIALTIIRRPAALGGGELRFLRREMRLTSQGLAEKMSVEPTLIEGWEQAPNPLPRVYDVSLRATFAGSQLGERVPELLMHVLSNAPYEPLSNQPLVFQRVERVWQLHVPTAPR